MRQLASAPLEFIDVIRGLTDPLVPPRGKIFVGSGDFKQVGNEFFHYLTKLADLQPDDVVLDVGCGIGRMAIPLTSYLVEGVYEGFDVVPEGIRWCQKNITPRFPNFHFQIADVANALYRTNISATAETYRFPYPDSTFDIVLVTSVFTHMRPRAVSHYLEEISRVLRVNGRTLITFFLLNDAVEALERSGKGVQRFPYRFDRWATADKNTPEAAIAYDEAFVINAHDRVGLEVKEPLRYGSWCGRNDYLSYQDMVLAVKK